MMDQRGDSAFLIPNILHEEIDIYHNVGKFKNIPTLNSSKT